MIDQLPGASDNIEVAFFLFGNELRNKFRLGEKGEKSHSDNLYFLAHVM